MVLKSLTKAKKQIQQKNLIYDLLRMTFLDRNDEKSIKFQLIYVMLSKNTHEAVV